ncbi:MAG: VOC family protein [Actinomycetota bacterium]|nr:VOC family protein [Actinomycetota bacterium]
MSRTLSVIRHGHVNQFCNDYDGLLDYYRTTFDSPVFMEFGTPEFGARNALYMAGGACFEVFAPTVPDLAIGSWIKRFGERWHSLEWTVPSLDEAIEIVQERGIRITDHAPDQYIFVHPRDCHGLSLELTEAHFEHDPREADNWDAAVGAGSNPIGISGGPIITLCVHDAQASAEWMAELTGRQLADSYSGTASNAAAIDFGDHIVEFVAPTGSDVDTDLREALAARGASIYAVTLPVRSLGAAEAELAARGAQSTRTLGGTVPLLLADTTQTGGALLRFRE